MVVRALRLSTQHHALIGEHVRSDLPLEVCGFLGGVGGEVTDVIPVPNVSSEPSVGFLMDPKAQWGAMHMLAEKNKDIIAIYHSHPPGSCGAPSPVDITNAHYTKALNLVVVPRISGAIASFRAFSIDEGQVFEVSIIVRP
jgi:proteasome lid subunit RPN8/RPN11